MSKRRASLKNLNLLCRLYWNLIKPISDHPSVRCTKTYDWGRNVESFWCRFWCEDILKGMPNELSNQAFCYFLAVEESSLLVLSVDVRLMGFCAAFCSWLFTKGAISLAPSYYLVRTPLTLKANTSFEVRSVKNRKLQSRQNMFSWPSKQV